MSSSGSGTKVSLSQEEYYDLGTFQRPIHTKSNDAGSWFNRGLTWSYAFNHEEAAHCFEQAITHDASCSMAYWGLAYCLGPNYNKPWDTFDKAELDSILTRGHRAAEQAHALATTAVEKALAQALRFRYPQRQAEDAKACAPWNKEYADAMRGVYENFPSDLDVAALFADALVNITPWALWDIRTGLPAEGAQTLEAKAVLDRALVLEGGNEHPGLLHLYIHLMEMSTTPEIAMPAADHLRGLIPDAGHLNHMPTHLDILCGDYRRAIASNTEAIRADERFLARAGALNFYSLYRSHNYHFRIYAAMFAGQSKVAINTIAQLEAFLPEELLKIESPPMADWLEGFISMRVHASIRFGRWQDILSMNLPQDAKLYCVTTAMIHYAKGVAFAATGRLREAEVAKSRFVDALKQVAPTRMLFNNTCVEILAIAKEMLDGELEYRRGNIDLAFKHLLKAIALDDDLPYDEPWGWMQPTRHAYGALLLEQDHVEKALRVYSADLGFDDTLPRALQHPNNVWALHGYHECCVKLGKTAEARIIRQQLRMATAIADVPVKSSCFCRLSVEDKVTV
ncbi:probable TPR domain protein [Rhynchosporium secalis]|uniref:Probable TPR domain protein n=1 Tax=Rhynchosporium secalis TaxID=38038 RepID=A0A1E1MRQ4_RHYSE|nr:probable TPR domain protein [Rhynchosporium secalis]